MQSNESLCQKYILQIVQGEAPTYYTVDHNQTMNIKGQKGLY